MSEQVTRGFEPVRLMADPRDVARAELVGRRARLRQLPNRVRLSIGPETELESLEDGTLISAVEGESDLVSYSPTPVAQAPWAARTGRQVPPLLSSSGKCRAIVIDTRSEDELGDHEVRANPIVGALAGRGRAKASVRVSLPIPPVTVSEDGSLSTSCW